MKNRILYVVIAVILVAGVGVGVWLAMNQQDVQPEATSQQNQSSTIPSTTPQDEPASTAAEVSYQGEDGQTALALLQEHAEVEMEGEGEMAFVTTINGYKAKDNEFWAFYIDGESAPVGAGTYVTKASDTITWKIETF